MRGITCPGNIFEINTRNFAFRIQIYQMWLFLGNRVKKWREHKRTKRD